MESSNAFLWDYVTCVWFQLQVVYHNVDIEERALGILITISCNYCQHFQGYYNLCSKHTINFSVLRALVVAYHIVLFYQNLEDKVLIHCGESRWDYWTE